MATPKDKEFEKPAKLNKDGAKAYRVIMEYLKSRDMTDSGGCKVFYSPQEWTERGEQYGQGSVLIVVYDGGEHRPAFTLDDGWQDYEALNAKLGEVGLRAEPCTGWYSAIYTD